MSLAEGAGIVKRTDVTRDAFLDGRLTIAQPTKGFRAGLDSVLLGAAVGRSTGQLLDLGAGVGTAGLVALSLRPGLRATLVESDAAMAELASENIAANGLTERARVVVLDAVSPGRTRAAAGLPADHFETTIANPPYYSVGTAPDRPRTAARHMTAEALDRWVRTAATHAAPMGEVVFIHVAAMLPRILESFAARFGALVVLPLSPREGEPAHRILVRGVKGSRAPLTLLSTRSIHAADGRKFRPEFDDIFRGRDLLHW